ncbi:MAG: hypothetical protein E6I80_19445 [Chloroflexi bacterium]|nr:MAG: hypothetical protein E6I80_19445 [Chloroflexota bacterium]
MTDSLKHLRELAEPEMLNKDTMLMPKAAADRWGWLPDKDTMLMPKAAADRWGWLPALSLTSAVGVFLLALAYNGGRDAAQWADPLFWFGLLVLFLPIAGRLLSLRASRRERIALLVVLGMALYLAKYLQYPLYFTYHDEFAHWRTAYDIAASGHLFQRNPIIPISSFYPGLEIATSALSSLTGLSLFAAGNVVLGVGRLVLILAVYLFFEHIISSARVAGIATLLYMANPHFLLFDADFSYESLALPLAMFVLFAVVSRSSEPGGRHRGLTLAIWLGLGTVVITHHVTSYALVAYLLLWTVVSSFNKGLLFTFRHKIADFHASLYPQRHGAMHQSRDQKDKDQAGPGWAALIGLALSIAWLIYTGDLAVGYLSPFLSGAVHQLAEIFFSRGPIRPLFQDASGFVAPLWERVMTYVSIGLILLGLPFGIFWIWKHKRSNALALTLGVVAFAYPVSQMFRLTKAGAESADRATAFLFLSLAFILAIGITEFWLPRTLTWRRSALVMGAIAVIFLGQVIAGGGPMWFRMPGPYLVIADPRSIEPEGISAAQWSDLYLGGGHRIATDRINGLLMATYGNEWIVEGVNEVVPPVFTSLQFGPKDKALLQQQHIQYLIVDRRLSTGLPRIGVYFEITASGIKQYNKPIDPEALTKFDGMKNVSRLFDSGNITIYDVEAITNPPTITSTSKTSCIPASPTAVASTYPHVANFYTGIIHDIPASLIMNISLMNIQQQQGAICGSFNVVPEKGLFNGIPQSGPFTGTVNTDKQIQFTVTSKTGQATFSFKGVMQPDGSIAGTYCSLRTATGKCSEYGLWSVSIPEQTRHR